MFCAKNISKTRWMSELACAPSDVRATLSECHLNYAGLTKLKTASTTKSHTTLGNS